MDHNNINQQQGGTGSAEQTGRDRDEQKLRGADANEIGKPGIAAQIGKKKKDITTIADLGGKSGLYDAAGGSGDRMENESTNNTTDRP